MERQRVESVARIAELRMEVERKKITQWVVKFVPISEEEATEQLYRLGIDITKNTMYTLHTNTMKAPAEPEEYDNTRGTITLRESRPNNTKNATLGRRGLGLRSTLISQEICDVSLTAHVFGSGSSESVGCSLKINMKKAPHEHAVYVNGHKLDMDVGVEKPLFGRIISFFGPTRFAYRVTISRETI